MDCTHSRRSIDSQTESVSTGGREWSETRKTLEVPKLLILETRKRQTIFKINDLAQVMKLVDIRDLKSRGRNGRVGSTPTLGTVK